MKKISVITPCYNEEANIKEVYTRTKQVFSQYPQYDYEHIFIDNCSQDRTVEEIKKIGAQDKRIKLIVNARNFGHLRSPYYALLQSTGDAGLIMAADLQDPPEMILQFLDKWEQGYQVVAAVKDASDEPWLYFKIRKMYYSLVSSLSEIELIPGFHGFGLLDKVVINAMRQFKDPYPYFRGVICEIGFKHVTVPFHQPLRKRGFTSNNFYTLYDTAMLGLVNHSKVPLRMAIFVGLFMAVVSFILAMVYLIYKIVYWNEFSLGTAPVVIGLFLISSIQLIFMGIMGEYLGSLYTQVKDRPLVIEKERFNFD